MELQALLDVAQDEDDEEDPHGGGYLLDAFLAGADVHEDIHVDAEHDAVADAVAQGHEDHGEEGRGGGCCGDGEEEGAEGEAPGGGGEANVFSARTGRG